MRNPFFAAPDLVLNIRTTGIRHRVYPTSQPDPWRRAARGGPGVGEVLRRGRGHGQRLLHGGQRTGDLPGRRSARRSTRAITSASTTRRTWSIAACSTPRGVTYAAQRPDPNEQTEFLTSTEQWFRPVNLLTGPDGMLYVVDMYRDIIEDYSAIPRYLQQLYVQSLIAGADRGRIWRMVPEQNRTNWRVDLTRATSAELVSHLAHANGGGRKRRSDCWWNGKIRRWPNCCAAGRRAVTQRKVRVSARSTCSTASTCSHPAQVMTALGRMVPRWCVCTRCDWPSGGWPIRRYCGDAATGADAHPRVQLQCALSLGRETRPPDGVPRGAAGRPRGCPTSGCRRRWSARRCPQRTAWWRCCSQGAAPATDRLACCGRLCSVVGARRDARQLAAAARDAWPPR